jgi:hypothetical protein
MRVHRLLLFSLGLLFIAAGLIFRTTLPANANQSSLLLSPNFQPRILSTSGESPLALRIFITAVKTDSRGRIITGPTSDPIKNIVGAEPAGERGGMQRFTKIMFGASYIDGRPDPGTRIDPNNPVVKSGSQVWPNIKQPFRSQPRSMALTSDGRKLYVTLPGREGYPDWRVAVVDTCTIYVANLQTEDVSFLAIDANGNLQRQGFLPVGVTPSTPDPQKGENGQGLFATDEEKGLRWFFSSAYSDDGHSGRQISHSHGSVNRVSVRDALQRPGQFISRLNYVSTTETRVLCSNDQRRWL